MFKRFSIIIALPLFALALFFLPLAPTKTDAYADGRAEIAMELNSGTVFHEKNADQKLPMASTTKIMTALIVAEECDLKQVITVPDSAVGVEGSSIYLKYGEQISVEDLLYGLMLRSGNDAACALAIHCGGSVEGFVDKMNKKAEELGAENTRFVNPSGLPADGHYTTARDLCNIARYAMQNETFRTVVSTTNYNGEFRSFTNKNKLLNMLDGANGVKTGYTERAGRCLVSSAKRDNMDVVCVVLNCYDMWERSTKIIEECFNRFSVEEIKEDVVFRFKGKSLTLKENCFVTTQIGKELKYEIHGIERAEDGAVAELKIYCENNLIFCHNLYTI